MNRNYFINLSLLTSFLIVPGLLKAQQWQRQNPYLTEQTLNGVFMTDVSHNFICGGNGEMYSTSNGGDTWSRVDLTTNEPLASVFFTNQQKGYYCYYNNIGRTLDGGISWTEQEIPVLGDFKKIWFLDENSGWAFGYYKSLFRTTDGGNTWIKLHNSTGVVSDFNQVGFIHADSGFIAGTYGSDTRGLLFSTFDGGVTLEEISIPEEITGIEAMKVISMNEIWIGATESFYSPEGPVVKIYHTLNQGSTWDTIVLGPIQTSLGVKAIEFFPNHKGRVLTTRDLFITSDGGANWEKSSFPQNIYSMTAMHWADEMNGLMTGLMGQTIKTTDGGLSYTEISQGCRASFRGVTFLDESLGFAGGAFFSQPKLVKTTNGGNEWTEVSLPDSLFSQLTDVSHDGDVLYLTFAKSYLLKSIDFGNTFTYIKPPDCQPLTHVKIPEDDLVVAVGYHDLYISENGGDTWETINISDPDFHIHDVDFIDRDKAYVSMKSTDSFPPPGYLLFTGNGGISWENVEYGEQNSIISFDFTDSGHGAISITQKGVSFTSDGGLTWTVPTMVNGYVPDFVGYMNDSMLLVSYGANMLAMTTHENTSWNVILDNNEGLLLANDYYFLSEKKGWLVGGAGMIMHYNNPLLDVPESDIPENNYITFYPNPVDDNLMIKQDLKVKSIIITDMQGRVLHQAKELNNHCIDVSFLTTGTYITSIQTIDDFYIFTFIKK